MIPLGFGFNENQRDQNCISQDASVTGFKRKVRNPGPEDHIRLHFFEPGLRTFLTYSQYYILHIFFPTLDAKFKVYNLYHAKTYSTFLAAVLSGKVNGRKPAYWYRYGRNDKIQRDAFVNASPWIHYFGYYHHIIVRLAMLSGAL